MNRTITEVVSGEAIGPDKIGAQWGRERGLTVHYYPAEWDKFGKRAGFLRNEEMAAVSDALIAVWDGKSRGTAHMIACATKRGLKVSVHRANQPKEPKQLL